ncbi:hypothetical protein HRI_003230100 [Hibiscus trionum]|uniref:Uncharacterized protein n=1 Tax=Hibiscus trionum TaxID=183268 RepID=A0A9W7IHW3_HIBTR|nr:hypothetical protein HRI_003230100 [Hibiscus trionum]
MDRNGVDRFNTRVGSETGSETRPYSSQIVSKHPLEFRNTKAISGPRFRTLGGVSIRFAQKQHQMLVFHAKTRSNTSKGLPKHINKSSNI